MELKYAAFILFVLVGCSGPVSADQKTNNQLEDWPARILSLAYALRHDPDILDKLEAVEGDERYSEANLLSKYRPIYDLLQSKQSEALPHATLIWLGHYCWVKNQEGFSCGDPDHRKFNDSGYLYVSDPIQGARPYIVMILSGISPAQTVILKLYSDDMIVIYNRFNERVECGLEDVVKLRVVYGVSVGANGILEITESNNRFDEDHARKFTLDIRTETCKLIKTWTAIPEE